MSSHFLEVLLRSSVPGSRTRPAPPTALPTPALQECSPISSLCISRRRNTALYSLEPELSHSAGYSCLHLSILPREVHFWGDRQHRDLSRLKISHSNPSCKSGHCRRAEVSHLLVSSSLRRANFIKICSLLGYRQFVTTCKWADGL